MSAAARGQAPESTQHTPATLQHLSIAEALDGLGIRCMPCSHQGTRRSSCPPNHHGTFHAMDTGHASCTTLCAARSSSLPRFSFFALLPFPPTLPALCYLPFVTPLCPAKVPQPSRAGVAPAVPCFCVPRAAPGASRLPVLFWRPLSMQALCEQCAKQNLSPGLSLSCSAAVIWAPVLLLPSPFPAFCLPCFCSFWLLWRTMRSIMHYNLRSKSHDIHLGDLLRLCLRAAS